MRYSIVAAAVLLSSASAVPHNKPHPCKRHDKDCLPSFSGTADPIVTGTGTGVARGTGLSTLTVSIPIKPKPTFANDNHGTAEHPLETSPDMPPPAGDKHAVADSDSQGTSGDKCAGGTVTITSKSTHTITVSSTTSVPTSSPSASPDESSTGSTNAPETEEKPASGSEGEDLTPASSPPSSPSLSPSPSPAPASNSAAAANAETPTSPSASPSLSASPDTASTAPSTGGTTGGIPFKTKRGLIASGKQQDALAGASGVGKISWLGSWYSLAPVTLPASVTFVPQNYGRIKGTADTGEWEKNAQTSYNKGARIFLSMGEPGTGGDRHFEPNEAVDFWRQKMEPWAAKGVQLGAPGTLQNTQDFDWLSKFLELCTGCHISFLAMHWFDKAAPTDRQVEGVKSTLQKAKVIADKYNVPVWLDNFSAEGSVEEQKAFLGSVVPWLDSQEWVKAYAYVPPAVGREGATGGSFLDEGAKTFNELGNYYANL